MTHYPHGEPPAPQDGDTCTVHRPEYGRHELWIWERSLRGWQYLAQGTAGECDAEAGEYL